jgi:hypothetical protein
VKKTSIEATIYLRATTSFKIYAGGGSVTIYNVTGVMTVEFRHDTEAYVRSWENKNGLTRGLLIESQTMVTRQHATIPIMSPHR